MHTSSVFERYRIETYKEAGYKPYVIAAMILTSRFKDVASSSRASRKRASRASCNLSVCAAAFFW